MSVSLDDTSGPAIRADGPRPEGTDFASLPGGADRRDRHDRANDRGPTIRLHDKEPDLIAGQQHPSDPLARTVRQHGGGIGRGAGAGAGIASGIPEDRKTPGAPTPDVLEIRWDVWNPDRDPTVAKR